MPSDFANPNASPAMPSAEVYKSTVTMSPQEEVEYLRSQIEKRTQAVENMPVSMTPEEHASAAIRDYKKVEMQSAPSERDLYMKKVSDIVGILGHKDTDNQVIELAGIMMDKGVRFAIDIAEKLGKVGAEDDFHRFLVAYLLSGHEKEFKSVSQAEWKALHLKLFEIIPPAHEEKDGQRDPKTYIVLMEQLYTALQSIANDPSNSERNYYSLEIALAQDSNEVVFYIAVPAQIEAILDKTLQGYFPGIEVIPHLEDYNIFSDNGYHAVAVARETQDSALPLKTYKSIEGDPITVIMNSFTKLKREGEGAALQILVRPSGETFKKKFGQVLDNMQKQGDTFEKAIKRETFFGGLSAAFQDARSDSSTETKTKGYQDSEHLKLVTEKISSTILETNIRLSASAETLERANFILADLEASFKQYTENNGNSIVFETTPAKAVHSHIHNFIYRLWSDAETIPLNLSELATLYHVPGYVKEFHQVKLAKMVTAPAPLDLSKDGVLLGTNIYRGLSTEIHFPREDRVRHMYVIGQTGTGKTSILKTLIAQDIANGDGCCFIDPHGSDIDDILANIPPERYDDVIYFDPSYTARPMGLNMLEYDPDKPEQKTFIINEILGIFDKLFDMKSSGGAGFEAMFRNTTQLVMEHPQSGNTLLEISRTLSDKDFRDYKLSKSKNPLIHQYWKNAEATTGEQGLANWVPYINSKIDPFLTNDIMRPIIAQEKSAFNLREIMDTKKIFLVNLSKGRLGDQNAYLIGLILIGKFLQAALGRVDSEVRPDFYLYIDEFQNVTTPSIAAILSEARKYRLSLNMAHQYISQLPENIKGAVFGNVGTMAVYRVGAEDAQFLEKYFAPTFTSNDIMKIENFNCYLKLLSGNKPQKPFSMAANNLGKGNRDQIQLLKERSYLKYGRPRDEVEEEILSKYNI